MLEPWRDYLVTVVYRATTTARFRVCAPAGCKGAYSIMSYRLDDGLRPEDGEIVDVLELQPDIVKVEKATPT
jgi:hypothetical protein